MGARLAVAKVSYKRSSDNPLLFFVAYLKFHYYMGLSLVFCRNIRLGFSCTTVGSNNGHLILRVTPSIFDGPASLVLSMIVKN